MLINIAGMIPMMGWWHETPGCITGVGPGGGMLLDWEWVSLHICFSQKCYAFVW